LEAERLRRVVVDTYTLIAMAYDEVGERARDVLNGIRRGRIEGLIPITVVYEYVVHWLRGRIPALRSLDEVVTYLRSYFRVEPLGLDDYIEAAKIKVRGDEVLRNAEDEALRGRRLSIVDSTVIALARRVRAPILSGDRDLAYVAAKEGIEVIW